MADPRPIGVFDSGVGGLTVVASLRKRLPRESILYLGDTARVPYGTKGDETVRRYAARTVDFLRREDVKMVVVACNTATALALPSLRAEAATRGDALPIYGVIAPGVEMALAAVGDSDRAVAVIATESTVRSDAYGAALRAHRADLTVRSRACPLFVPLVEEGWADDPITEQVARRYLDDWLGPDVGVLVLGCTHYPLLASVLARVAGPAVRLVDSADATADAVARALGATHRAAPADATASLRLCVTDASDRFQRVASAILGRPATLTWVDL
ncbi:MAG: glutamate racemase [Acidobacteriota bacterium]